MERIASIVNPYIYPGKPHQRTHGPAGYANYTSYRPWLEDEFFFRCVYCLKRMVWAPTDQWVVDHLIPLADAPELECEYDNLVFACQFCNEQKGASHVRNPCQVGYGSCLIVEADGTVRPTRSGGYQINQVAQPESQSSDSRAFQDPWYHRVIRAIRSRRVDRYLGYPTNLPISAS